MKSIFTNSNGVSPVSQDFVWAAEYYDGTHLPEFDFATHKENSFYDIDREKLIRFGLIGQGMKLSFDVDGVFYLNGASVELLYEGVNGKKYPLTGLFGKYRDIISYKDAESTILPGRNSGVMKTNINQYNFGYKSYVEFDDIKFNFKAICKVPLNQPVHFNFGLVSSQKINGSLIIRRNNVEVLKIKAPLKSGVGGEINWIFE